MCDLDVMVREDLLQGFGEGGVEWKDHVERGGGSRRRFGGRCGVEEPTANLIHEICSKKSRNLVLLEILKIVILAPTE